MSEMGPFSKEEKEFIEKNYDKISIGNIAKHLNRTLRGVKKYIDEELNKIREQLEKIERRLDHHIVRVDAVSRYNIDI